MPDKQYPLIIRILQLSVITVLLGRGWQHLFWDAPFRTLLWDEYLMRPVIETFSSYQWEDYITSLSADDFIQWMIRATGILYILTALAALLLKAESKLLKILLILSATSLILLAGLYCKEKFYSLGQFFEYSLQFMSPLFLLFLLKAKTITPRLLTLLKISIALTFICHGLYAMNLYPLPGPFMHMTTTLTGLSEPNARTFLLLAGILDVIVGLLIFLPGRRALPFLGYAIFWGFLTCMARIATYVELDFLATSAHQWVHESVYRFPHFLIPLVVYLWVKRDEVNAPTLQHA